MTRPGQRPPGASIIGAHGPAVVLTGPAAAFLDELRRATPIDVLEHLQRRYATHWDTIAPELTAVGVVGAAWRTSHTRPAPARVGDTGAASEEIGTGTAATLLRVDVRTVQRMIHDGRLPGRKVGGRWLISRSALRAA